MVTSELLLTSHFLIFFFPSNLSQCVSYSPWVHFNQNGTECSFLIRPGPATLSRGGDEVLHRDRIVQKYQAIYGVIPCFTLLNQSYSQRTLVFVQLHHEYTSLIIDQEPKTPSHHVKICDAHFRIS